MLPLRYLGELPSNICATFLQAEISEQRSDTQRSTHLLIKMLAYLCLLQNLVVTSLSKKHSSEVTCERFWPASWPNFYVIKTITEEFLAADLKFDNTQCQCASGDKRTCTHCQEFKFVHPFNILPMCIIIQDVHSFDLTMSILEIYYTGR